MIYLVVLLLSIGAVKLWEMAEKYAENKRTERIKAEFRRFQKREALRQKQIRIMHDAYTWGRR